MIRFLFFAVAVSLSLSCQQYQITETIPVDTEFKIATPKSEDLKKYQQAALYSAKTQGAAVLIIHSNKIVFEEYQNGYTSEQPLHVFSGTKSFAGVLAMAAVADGVLKLDEKVADTFTEYKNRPWKSKITVRHLLHFTSGLRQRPWMLTLDGFKEPKKQVVKDKYSVARQLNCITEPGAVYQYGSSHLMVFGALMKEKLKEDPLVYLKRRVFDPMGFRYAGWYKDPEGNPAFPYGAWTTAREWAKFGIFLKDDGKFRGKQILQSGLLKECTIGSEAMPAYGLTFWLNKEVPGHLIKDLIPDLKKAAVNGPIFHPNAPEDSYCAAGAKGNRLYIFPSLDLVIVRLGDGKSYKDSEFLEYFFAE